MQTAETSQLATQLDRRVARLTQLLRASVRSRQRRGGAADVAPARRPRTAPGHRPGRRRAGGAADDDRARARLEQDGLVAGRRDAADARAVLVALTDAGRDQLRAVRADRAAVLQTRLDRLDDDARAALAAALTRSSTNCSEATDSPRLLDQPRSVYAVAFACVVAFMGIGLVDPILPDARRGSAGDAEPGVAAVHELLRDDRRVDARHAAGSRRGSARAGRCSPGSRWSSSSARWRALLEHGVPDRLLPARLGRRQRAVHRHRAVGDRRRGDRRADERDHPLRGRARPRHRLRAAARRPAGRRSPGAGRSSAPRR